MIDSQKVTGRNGIQGNTVHRPRKTKAHPELNLNGVETSQSIRSAQPPPNSKSENAKERPKSFSHSRPIHVIKSTSLLSRFRKRKLSATCDCGRDVGSQASLKFDGFKHLVMITLFLGSLRLLWIDSHIKGIRYALEVAGFQRLDLKYGLYLLLMNAIYLPLALLVEKLAARGSVVGKSTQSVQGSSGRGSSLKWKLVAIFHILNASACLIISSIYCYRYIWNPLIGTICEANTIITFLKLSSYCLTVRDLRQEYFSGLKVYDYYGDLPYPGSLTAGSAVYFWFAPTLVYQPVYPRTEKIRWQLAFSLVGETMIGMFFIWMLGLKLAAPTLRDALQHYQNQDYHLVDDFIKLCAINITIWLLGFFVIFQSMLNLLAEITQFADRDFYQDWWNAGCLGTYWRDWNKPVANYLRRHIYSPLRKHGVNSTLAGLVVFFISAVFHEVMVGVATKNFNGVAFFSMISQVPLIRITAPLEKIRGRGTTIGNCIFWLSILLGQPTGVIIYYVSWCLRNEHS